jgi:O-antigen ligase
MTTTAPPPPVTRVPPPPRAPRRGPKTALLVVAGLVGAVVLGFLGQSTSGLVATVGLLAVVGVSVVVVYLRNDPALIVPALVFSMWFEALGVGQFSLGRILAALVPLLMVALIVSSNWRPPALEPRGWLPIALLIVWAWAGGLYSQTVSGAGGWFFSFLALFLGIAYALGIAVFLEGPEQLERLMRTWVLIGLPIAALGVVIFFTLGNRIFGLTGGPNTYATYVTEVLPFCVLFARRERGRGRVVMYAAILIYLGGLLATGSRGGMVGAAVVGMYIFATLPGISRSRRVVTIITGVLAMFALLFLFGLLNAERFSLGAILSDRGAGRLDIWNAGMQVMRDNWVIGLGLGGFASRAIQFLQLAENGQIGIIESKEVIEQGGINAHNLYLGLTLDMGVIGLTLYMAVVASAMKNLWDLRHTRWGDLAWAFQGTIIASLVAGMFGGAFNHKFLWLIVGAAASAYTRRRMTPRPGVRIVAARPVVAGVADGTR